MRHIYKVNTYGYKVDKGNNKITTKGKSKLIII